jgi:hypothetical protein
MQLMLGKAGNMTALDDAAVEVIAAAIHKTCVANNRPSLASKMSISYISMNKIYRLRPRPVMRDAFVIYFNIFR